MPAPRSLAVMFVIALLGGLAGALITLAITDPDREARGMVVTLGGELNFDNGPWCDPHHRFCIPEYTDPAEARAFYMVHTHVSARERACPVEWLPDQETASYVDSANAPPGAFRGRCIGNVWLEDGTDVFGPAPRDLDEFPVEVRRETRDLPGYGPQEYTWLEVDTRTLICGDWAPSIPRDEIPNPECELAPPYD